MNTNRVYSQPLRLIDYFPREANIFLIYASTK